MSGDLSAVSLALLIGTILLLIIRSKRPQLFPPGPLCLPALGNTLTIMRKTLVYAFRDWRKDYGDIFSVAIGTKWVIVINGYENLREAFVKRGDSFSERPDIFVVREITKRHGIIGNSGPIWKEQRTFTLGALRDFGFGKKSLEVRVKEEVEVFLGSVEETKGQTFILTDKIHISISNIICSIVFGERFEYDDKTFDKFLQLMNQNFSNSALAGVLNFMPFLTKIPGDLLSAKRLKHNIEQIMDFVEDRIQEHRNTFDEDNLRDFIDAYINEMNKCIEKDTTSFTEFQFVSTIRDLFIAGTETTATGIKWAILYMLHNPGIQEKMHEEILQVVGLGRLPSIHDKTMMPYCEAVIHETLRMGNIVPLSVPHGTNEDVIFKGFTIPKDAVVIANLDSVLTDEEMFPEPSRINPERFLDKEGKLQGFEKVLAFSLGRRMCLGESLARMEMFLFLTSMVQRFKFLPPKGEPAPPIVRRLGISFSPAPYPMRAVLRV